MRARVVAPNELTSSDLARWSECAACSLEPNPFFEPDWLLPALDYLGESPTTMLVLAEHRSAVQAFLPIAVVAADESGAAGHRAHSALVTSCLLYTSYMPSLSVRADS